MRSHKCYDIVPTSSKLVVFDTTLQVSQCAQGRRVFGVSLGELLSGVTWLRPETCWRRAEVPSADAGTQALRNVGHKACSAVSGSWDLNPQRGSALGSGIRSQVSGACYASAVAVEPHGRPQSP